MVVADPIFVERRRPGGLNAPEQTLGDEHAERVVDRLEGDGADLGPDDLGGGFSGEVRLARYGPHHSQALGGHLDAALTKLGGGVESHGGRAYQSLE
jgi:hypothetical protein